MKILKWLAARWVQFVLLIATTIYLKFAFGLIVDAGSCAPALAPDHWYWEFYYRYLACREINVLGDTFAGFFAPLAFIWLAGAVYIQSQELSAQRKELDETQEVMREQLSVAREQVRETIASTALFDEQTQILKRQQELKEQELCDEAFEALLRKFMKDYSERQELKFFCLPVGLMNERHFDIGFHLWSPPRANAVLFRELRETLQTAQEHLFRGPQIVLVQFSHAMANQMLSDLILLEALIEKTTETNRINVAELDISATLPLLRDVLNRLTTLANPDEKRIPPFATDDK